MENVRPANPSFFLRNLLIEPRYRGPRHLLLVLVLAVTALNQSFMTLRAGMDALGWRIFLQAAFLFASYLAVCYFNLWVLLPRYLLGKRYLRYMLSLSAAIFLLVLVHTLEERAVLFHMDLPGGFYSGPRIYITLFSSFALVLICVSGGAITVLLKRWMIDNREVNRLEKLHMQSEVEQLKEQISPRLLFNILNHTAALAQQQPAQASEMLMRLSRLLRYQLYDCNRDGVLLSAEIKFLNNYLLLEQMDADRFDFHIQSDKACAHAWVSPLLFISFVQGAILRIQALRQRTSLHIVFAAAGEGSITFVCRSGMDGLFFNLDFSPIRKRLDLLYSGRYALAVTGREITLTLDIS